MVHFYTNKRYSSRSYKILCTKKWETDTREEPSRWIGGPKIDPFAMTVPARITCPDCLDILIPIEEKKLTEMKSARFNARNVPAPENVDAVVESNNKLNAGTPQIL